MRCIHVDHAQIAHKIRRIAYQIYETNVDEDRVVIAGIRENGLLLAKKSKVIPNEIDQGTEGARASQDILLFWP